MPWIRHWLHQAALTDDDAWARRRTEASDAAHFAAPASWGAQWTSDAARSSPSPHSGTAGNPQYPSMTTAFPQERRKTGDRLPILG